MIVPFIIGALALGKAFDIFGLNSTPFYVFDSKDVILKLQTTASKSTESRYKIINNSTDTIEFLHLDPELALKVKKRSMSIPGGYTFLSTPIDRFRTTEILFYVYHEVETRSFPPSTKQVTDWQQRPQSDVGTHYIQGMKYGGELLVSYQITPSKSEYFKDVKDAVEEHFGSSGPIDSTLLDKLQKLDQSIKDKAYGHFLSAVSGVRVPDPSSLPDAVRLAVRFPEEVEKVSSGKRTPVRLVVEDLHTLKSSYKPYVKNMALVPLMIDAYGKYDDILIARRNYESFEDDHISTRWPEHLEKMMNDYYRKLKKAERAMTKAISYLDGTGNSDQFDEAFSAYGDGADKYQAELQKLIEKLLEYKQF